jgi:hypothetical protein
MAYSPRAYEEYTEAIYHHTLRLKEATLGKDHPDTLGCMNDLAELLRLQGKCTEASAMHERALQLRKTVLGADHPDTLSSMNNFAKSPSQVG